MFTEETQMFFEDLKDKLEKIKVHHSNELLQIRAGRANPKLIERVLVDYYGVLTPISQMATISVPEARMLLVNVWDNTQIKAVVKAIEAANLGLNPSDDGRVIRLIFPELTEERRKEFVKEVNKITENSKVACRNARRDILDEFKTMKKNSEISEDDLVRIEKEVQKIINEAIADIDKVTAKKEKDLMEV